VDKLHELMGKPSNIRNFTMIGTLDHGCATLSKVLDEKAGVRLYEPNAPPLKQARPKKDEGDNDGERKSASIALFHREILPEPEASTTRSQRTSALDDEEPKDKRGSRPVKKEEEKLKQPEVLPEEYILNLIDSQGHAEFSSDVASALRVSDGALIVVDCISGMALETETGLRYVLALLPHTRTTLSAFFAVKIWRILALCRMWNLQRSLLDRILESTVIYAIKMLGARRNLWESSPYLG